jgi:Fe(3+) dicitrate transport protein
LGAVAGTAQESSDELDPVLVSGAIVGSKAGVNNITGSATYLDIDDLRVHSINNINSALRRVPGAYVRPEDGYGNFPNISLRGVDMGRSSKVTIMEDGILAAPATYTAPSAYYSPTVERMSGLEVIKGSSQVKYGPHTTGGVINYLSTSIPDEVTTYSKTYYGEFDELVSHIYHGGKVDTASGKIGYLVEGYYRDTDGFKELSHGDTGFTRSEPMIKLSWEPNTSNYQSFELKLGSTDFDANETYLGIRDDDFKSNPYQRYAASRNDEINTYASRGYLRHFIELGSNASLKTTGYFSKFHRNWFKLDKIGIGETDGKKNYDKSAYKVWNDAAYYSVLTGNSAGNIRLKNNNRDYSQQGIESVLNYDLSLGGLENQIQLGARFHKDDIDRFQWYTTYDQADDGSWSTGENSDKGKAGDRNQETDAFSLYLEDRIAINDQLSIVPGIRYEDMDYSYDQDTRYAGKTADDGSGGLDVVTGGVGFSYDANENLNVFGGVYAGTSLPGPRAFIRSQGKANLEEETSTSFELGARYEQEAFAVTGAVFYTVLEDFIVPDNYGTGFEEWPTDPLTGKPDKPSKQDNNDGEITSLGLELQAAYDFGIANGADYSLPVHVGITLTNAEFDGNASSADGESIFSGSHDGNEVPYVPDFLLHAGIGYAKGNLRLALDGSYVSESNASGWNNSDSYDPEGKYNAQYGKIDSYFVADLSAHYSLTENTTVFATARNVFDEEYVVGRLPQGARPGMPQQLLIGVESQF